MTKKMAKFISVLFCTVSWLLCSLHMQTSLCFILATVLATHFLAFDVMVGSDLQTHGHT